MASPDGASFCKTIKFVVYLNKESLDHAINMNT